MLRSLLLGVVAVACGLPAEGAVEPTAMLAVPGTCVDDPTPRAGRFRHGSSRTMTAIGSPQHRGYDLIAVESDEKQTLGGKLAYTKFDKDLKDEDVIVFACVDGSWRGVGTARTDRDGRFELALTGADRLPAGMRDLFASVPGDGSGVRFLAYVAREGESVIVTDLDGTVTESEKAVFRTVLLGDDIAHRRDAPEALRESKKTVIYLSARGDQLSQLTREWLATHKFPPGPIRLSRSFATKPGPKTIATKTAILRGLPVPIHAAIGNRQTDVAAYTNAGIPAHRIFIKLPEFEGELAEDLGARRAVGFTSYRMLAPHLR
jgi:phosphatidate phosphatase PAH1